MPKTCFLRIGLLIILLPGMSGCAKETAFKGDGAHWKVQFIQNVDLEHLELAIRYAGTEDTIEDFRYVFAGGEMNGAAGTEPGVKNAKYIFGHKWQVIGQRKIEEPLSITIGWNGQEEKIELTSRQK
ncbi:hypothetical protein NDS46_19695 [Paenibacillus thiaminolyticus]|uniref:hypothetical protein n=1 Tax=Paenibacillus thiaminolyticus TaxID=49283 RepID=UPI00233043CB|nr:hypothetical protein [Paenibacillus thiaminolyticus]WCF06566.1 hypothetical protein NDS46_19695 [Paenibacillus thiaminolyticus]